MRLGNLLDTKTNFEKILERNLAVFIMYFQKHHEGKSYPITITEEDMEAINALCAKIKHMSLNIGCPNSVRPMLQSIVKRQIKHWQAGFNVETPDRKRHTYNDKGLSVTTIKKGFRMGKQLKNRDELRRVYNAIPYYKNEVQKRVIGGHFRWNWRGYVLSRRATDLLGEFLESEF